MNRLVLRLVLSHLVVAAVGAATTFVLVRVLAPQAFDAQMHMMGQGMSPGQGMGLGRGLREQFVAAVNSSLAWGVLAGVVTAGAVGTYAAYRLIAPLTTLGAATRQIAQGRYAVDVPDPGTRELDALAGDVRSLAHTLGETEARRTRLLGEVAHELRTPLTVVDGYVEGMLDGVLPLDAGSLTAVTAETRRLRRLADDLSALSRAEEGRLGVVPRAVDVAEVVTSAAERLRPQAVDAGLELVVSAGGLVEGCVDPERVAQVVTNLVGNALRATPAGGRVTVTTRRDPAGEAVVVEVSDTGEGLAAEDLERVFERFYRVRGRSAGAGGPAGGPPGGAGAAESAGAAGGIPDHGTGVGLTISRGIALAHAGTLTAASPGLGQGSTFTLTLPLTGVDARPRRPATTAAPVPDR